MDGRLSSTGLSFLRITVVLMEKLNGLKRQRENVLLSGKLWL